MCEFTVAGLCRRRNVYLSILEDEDWMKRALRYLGIGE